MRDKGFRIGHLGSKIRDLGLENRDLGLATAPASLLPPVSGLGCKNGAMSVPYESAAQQTPPPAFDSPEIGV